MKSTIADVAAGVVVYVLLALATLGWLVDNGFIRIN